MSERHVLELIGKRIGNYVVERNLAHGAMGTVCIATHPTLKRQVAVKFIGLDQEIPEDHQQRFLDEACITANLRHPNIIDIFDFGELDGRLYYVMELLEGQDLSAVMKRERRFDIRSLQTYVSQICAGLHAAHTVGVVHRDLKPSNIFVLAGEPTRIKLMDFGVAKVLSGGGDRTHQGQIIGTPRYMSPEQALGQVDKISPKSDIYSLGVILYEMLTGRPVFENDLPMMLLVMHIHDEVRPIRDTNPTVPPEVSRLIESCLAKRPEERPSSAQELAVRFEDLLLGLSTVAESISTPPEARAAIEPAEPVSGMATQPPSVASQPPPTIDTPHDVDSVLVQEPDESCPARANDAPIQPPIDAGAMVVGRVAEAKPATPHERAPGTIRLTKADRDTLNKLWTRMQRGGDFPAFVRNVGEVSKRADFESTYSATQLGDSILKDFALTAKLLRVVNSTYANRFGGKVYSVQHAIVILGFDRVRSLALSISLFKKRGSEEHEQNVSDSAIHSLASGELAQQLAPRARVYDEEQAMMCGMFRNLGRHLVIVYLPEMYDQMLRLLTGEQISQSVAAERVFGISLQKIGLGVAERWRLPKPLLRTMSLVSNLSGSSEREEDRVVQLADLANELCDIVMNCPEQRRKSTITSLLLRHQGLINLDQDQIAETLQNVRQSFEQRYASLLGIDAKNSRFSRNVATLVSGEVERGIPDRTASRLCASDDLVSQMNAANASPIQVAVHAQPARPKALPIQLAKVSIEADTVHVEKAEAMAIDASLNAEITELARALSTSGRDEKLVNRILKLWAEQLNLSKYLVLKPNAQKNELTVVGGVHSELDALAKEFRVSISPAKSSTDVFSQAFFQNKDVVIEDTYSAKASTMVPLRYYEVIGAPTTALYPCVWKGHVTVVLLVQTESPKELPSSDGIRRVAELRPLIACAVS